MAIPKNFRTIGTNALVAAALTLQEYLSPNERERRAAMEMVEVEPQEVPDLWEELMEAYLDPDHPENAYAIRVMEAEQDTDPEGVKLRNHAFFQKVKGQDSPSGYGGKKWWDKSEPVEDTEVQIQRTITESLEMHKENAAKVERLGDQIACDYCQELAESSEWQEHGAEYICIDCGSVLCKIHANKLYVDRPDDDLVCFYCGDDLEPVDGTERDSVQGPS